MTNNVLSGMWNSHPVTWRIWMKHMKSSLSEDWAMQESAEMFFLETLL